MNRAPRSLRFAVGTALLALGGCEKKDTEKPEHGNVGPKTEEPEHTNVSPADEPADEPADAPADAPASEGE